MPLLAIRVIHWPPVGNTSQPNSPMECPTRDFPSCKGLLGSSSTLQISVHDTSWKYPTLVLELQPVARRACAMLRRLHEGALDFQRSFFARANNPGPPLQQWDAARARGWCETCAFGRVLSAGVFCEGKACPKSTDRWEHQMVEEKIVSTFFVAAMYRLRFGAKSQKIYRKTHESQIFDSFLFCSTI